MPQTKTLYIVDPDGDLARSLASLLASRDLRVEIRSDGEELLANFDADRAACVLVETHTPGMGAIEIGRQLGLRGVAIPVIPIDARAVVGLSAEAIEASIAGLSGEATGSQDSGHVSLGQRLETVERPKSQPRPGPDTFPSIELLRERFQRLTSREQEVARLAAQGYSSKELARALNLSKSTVDNHRARILEKLQLDNFVQVSRALSLLVPPQ